MYTRLCSLIAMCLLLPACQVPHDISNAWDQTGRKHLMPRYDTVSTKTLLEKVIVGESSRVDVYNVLGAPASISHANQLPQGISSSARPVLPTGTTQIWTYHLNKARNTFPIDPRPVQLHTVTATVLFDYQGRVLDFQVAELAR